MIALSLARITYLKVGFFWGKPIPVNNYCSLKKLNIKKLISQY